MLKFCSDITNLILKYHPREALLGSAVVYIKASLVKGEEGQKGLRAASCSHTEVPRVAWGKRDLCGSVLLKAHAQALPGAF